MEQYVSWVVALLLGGAAIIVVFLPWGKGRGQVEVTVKEEAPPSDKKAEEVATPKEDERLEVEPTPSPQVDVEVKAADPPQREAEAQDQPKGSRKRRRKRETTQV